MTLFRVLVIGVWTKEAITIIIIIIIIIIATSSSSSIIYIPWSAIHFGVLTRCSSPRVSG